jgi:hypothetical protein
VDVDVGVDVDVDLVRVPPEAFDLVLDLVVLRVGAVNCSPQSLRPA